MPFDKTIVKKQVIALLGLAVRNTSNVPTYSTSLGDTTYATEEIDKAIDLAVSAIMGVICDTDGHPDRDAFSADTAVTHGQHLPKHYGSIGVPVITPFSGATYTLKGKVKSVEEISAYRANPANLYSAVNHNVANNGLHSKLAGFYAIDNNVFHFTGHSATANLTKFTDADFTLLPDRYYEPAVPLSIANLRKEGALTNIFDANERLGQMKLAEIRGKEMYQPSIKKTIGNREKGDK